MAKRNITGLIESNKRISEEKECDVLAAIERLKKANVPITVSSVSAEACVSRQYIYKKEEILSLVRKYSTGNAKRNKGTMDTHITNLKSIIRNKDREIARLKKEIEENERYKERYEEAEKKNKDLQEQLETLYSQTLPTSL